MPGAGDICRNLDLYSSVASCSSGVELERGQIVLFGNAPGAGGRFRIGHGVMRDALDIDGIYDGIRNAGLDLPERPRASDLGGRLVNCSHQVRGRPHGPPARAPPDHAGRFRRAPSPPLKGAVGGVAAAAIGDPAVFVSVDAMHQGPQGGGPVVAIVDVGA